MLGWRRVPVNNENLGESVLPTEPAVWQVFIARGPVCADQAAFERKLFIIRKQIEKRIGESASLIHGRGQTDFYIASMSSRVINYKGMLLAGQLSEYYPDLLNHRMESALALVHQRFSTTPSRPGGWRIRTG